MTIYVTRCMIYLVRPPLKKANERCKQSMAQFTWTNKRGFPGDTVDKMFTHVMKLYGDKAALGTREFLEVYEEKRFNGRVE
uniref:Retrotransposon protein n=1 Tax=Elaeophora elaphi TaxID=1147741 RepID=A0A0R3RX72_9BILA